MSRESAARVQEVNEPFVGFTRVKMWEVLALVPPPLPDGVHEVTCTKVAAQGSRIRATFACDDGVAEVPIGRLADRRTLNRNLRTLLGTSEFYSVKEIRAALVGETFVLKFNTFYFNGNPYRGINRP